jgi:thiopurine S-methyltransferase
LAPLGAVYDRAALIALPHELRARYATHMIRLLEPSVVTGRPRFLQIVLERTPTDDKGPPFSVSEAELQELYGRRFKIERISREPVDIGGSRGDSSATQTEECVYTLN